MINTILASTSTLYNGSYLDYLLPELSELYKDCTSIVFVPFARPSGISHDDYTAKVYIAFEKINKKIVGLHTFSNPAKALEEAEGIFTGGGNTFLIVKQLYDQQLMKVLQQVVTNGTPYLGTSAGSNIAGLTMQTTNDMPIVYPPCFETLGLVPFTINAHYLDPDPNSTHNGETRETRIKEYHCFNDTPVIGLREGSWLEVKPNEVILKGNLTARLFKANETPTEVDSNTNLLDLVSIK